MALQNKTIRATGRSWCRHSSSRRRTEKFWAVRIRSVDGDRSCEEGAPSTLPVSMNQEVYATAADPGRATRGPAGKSRVALDESWYAFTECHAERTRLASHRHR